jgi:hypothetical protein
MQKVMRYDTRDEQYALQGHYFFACKATLHAWYRGVVRAMPRVAWRLVDLILSDR